jgi:ABC-type Fe3+ transport system substrate-binding protein
MYAIGAVIIVLVLSSSLYYYFGVMQKPDNGGPDNGGPDNGGPDNGTPPSVQITLKIITRHATDIWIQSKSRFLASDIAKEYNITDLQFMSPHPTLWRDTISGKGDLDLAWGGGPTLFDQLKVDDLLEPIVDNKTLQALGEIEDSIGGASLKSYEDGKVVWTAAAISSFGFIVNPPILDGLNLPYPEVWEDLASLEFAKPLPTPAVAYADPSTSTSHTRIYQIILQKFGWSEGWTVLTRLGGNGRDYGGSVEALGAVEAGEVPVAIAIDFYGYGAEIQFGNKYILPFNQSIVNGDPIALLKTTKNKEAALAFFRWVISVEGQEMWLHNTINRMPIREDVFWTEEGMKRNDMYQNYNVTIDNIGIPFNDSLALDTEWALRYYFGATINDEHELLVETWRKIIDAHTIGSITKAEFDNLSYMLGEPLSWEIDNETYQFTLEYAKSINDRLFKEEAFVSEMRKIWRDAAVERYETLQTQILE